MEETARAPPAEEMAWWFLRPWLTADCGNGPLGCISVGRRLGGSVFMRQSEQAWPAGTVFLNQLLVPVCHRPGERAVVVQCFL